MQYVYSGFGQECPPGQIMLNGECAEAEELPLVTPAPPPTSEDGASVVPWLIGATMVLLLIGGTVVFWPKGK